MTALKIEFKTNQVYAYLREVPRAAEQATQRALNSMAGPVRNEATKQIIGMRRLPTNEVKKQIAVVKRASPRSLSIVWRATGKPYPLKRFIVSGGEQRPRTSTKTPQKARRFVINRANRYNPPPVVVEVTRGKPRVVRGGFIGPGGHVYRRIGADRLPIKRRFSPGIPGTFVQDQVTDAMIRLSNTELPKRIESEMVRQLRKIETGRLPPLK